MIRRVILIALPAFVTLEAQPRTFQRTPLAMEHVTVIDVVGGRRLADHTVVVSDARITSVGPASRITIPSGADGRCLDRATLDGLLLRGGARTPSNAR